MVPHRSRRVATADVMTKTPLPPLPLSQQVLAWTLQGLGLESREFSRSTRRTALSGQPIQRRWDDLVIGFLKALGGVKDGRERGAKELARRWDHAVSELPSLDLTLGERLQVPLQLAVPQFGVRLGVLACILAAQTEGRVADYVWITRPFADDYFGRVFLALCRYKWKGASDLELAAKFAEKLDWRTVEHWRAGDTTLPSVGAVAVSEEVLGARSGAALRAARLAAALRASLLDWVGPEALGDFSDATATVAQRTAETLCVPEYRARLLAGLAADLRGAGSEEVLGVVRPWLPLKADVTAEEAADFVTASTPALGWLLPLLLAVPTPQLIADVAVVLGTPGLVLAFAADSVQVVKQAWLRRAVIKVAAGGTAEPALRGDGSVLELDPAIRDLAKRYLAQPLRCRRSVDDIDETPVLAALLAATGGTLEANALEGALSSLLQMGVEAHLDDDAVAGSAPLSLARATRLAKGGDPYGAMAWFRIAGERGAFRSLATLIQAADTVAGVCHAVLDACRPMRAVWQTTPADDPDRQVGSETLRGTVATIERLVTVVFPVEANDVLVWTEPDVFVPLAALHLRLAVLREEIDPEGQYLASMCQLLSAKADGLLARHVAHGRLWAIRTMAATDAGEYQRLAKRTVHFGGGDFLATASARIDEDLGLTRDAG